MDIPLSDVTNANPAKRLRNAALNLLFSFNNVGHAKDYIFTSNLPGFESLNENCVTIHPDPSQKDVLLFGMQNKKIMQYDLRKHDVVQVYDCHLGPVNSIAFEDSNKEFISTSGKLYVTNKYLR